MKYHYLIGKIPKVVNEISSQHLIGYLIGKVSKVVNEISLLNWKDTKGCR